MMVRSSAVSPLGSFQVAMSRDVGSPPVGVAATSLRFVPYRAKTGLRLRCYQRMQ